MNKEEKFRCPLREEDVGSDVMFSGLDYWIVRSNGDLCCSYCGAMHPEQFLTHCDTVVSDPEMRISIEWLPVKGKFYVSRPEVIKTGEGALTSMTHIHQWMKSTGLSEEKEKSTLEQINKAIEASQQKFKELYR